LRVAIFAIFLTFVISCNFRQFWPIFVAVSGDLIGHFLYTSNFHKILISEFSAIFYFVFAKLIEKRQTSLFLFFERMSPARWGHPDGCPPAWAARNVISAKKE
jgi:hypothetical protein